MNRGSRKRVLKALAMENGGSGLIRRRNPVLRVAATAALVVAHAPGIMGP
jgi:hypothetical protein